MQLFLDYCDFSHSNKPVFKLCKYGSTYQRSPSHPARGLERCTWFRVCSSCIKRSTFDTPILTHILLKAHNNSRRLLTHISISVFFSCCRETTRVTFLSTLFSQSQRLKGKNRQMLTSNHLKNLHFFQCTQQPKKIHRWITKLNFSEFNCRLCFFFVRQMSCNEIHGISQEKEM